MVPVHARIEESNFEFLKERKAYYGLESRNAVLNMIIREARLSAEKEEKSHGNIKSSAAKC